MNQTNESKLDSDRCIALTNIYNDYVEKSIGALAFALNTLCALVFLKIIRFQGEDVYKYLLSKSIFDSYMSLRISLKSVFNCQDCVVEHIYGLKVFYLIFFMHIYYSAEIISALLDMAANFNRYRFLANRFKIFNKISFTIVILSITFFTFLFQIYIYFDSKIISKTKNNGTETVYSIKSGNLLSSIILDSIKIMLRDVFSPAFIIILNALTLLTVKKAVEKKKLMLQGKTSKLMKKAEMAEFRLTLMVVTLSFVILFAHVIDIVILLAKNETIVSNKCIITVTYFLYLLSFLFYFFIYLFFNLSFKKYLFALFGRKKCLSC